MSETASYTRRAIKSYQDKFDYVNVRLEAGTKERIKAVAQGRSMSEYISDIVYKSLLKDEQHNNTNKQT